MKNLLTLLPLLFVGFVHAEEAVRDAAASGEFKTTVTEFANLTDATRERRRVPMKLHLPDAEGSFAVVIVSHGAGGNWDANSRQASHLASHGYAVICLEHIGSNSKSALAGGLRLGKTIAAMTTSAEEVLARPKDVSFAINKITEWNRSHVTLRGKFDIDRIGVMGHSFGAYTTLAVCGARPALDWLQPKVGAGMGLGADQFDRRVRCGVALSPQGPGKPFFLPESYATIRVPLLGISGSRDKQQFFEPSHRKDSFELWPTGDRFLLWISNANHLSFSDSGDTRRGQSRLLKRAASRREDVQKVSRAATLHFFDKYLKKTRSASLSAEDLAPYAQGIARDIELLKK